MKSLPSYPGWDCNKIPHNGPNSLYQFIIIVSFFFLVREGNVESIIRPSTWPQHLKKPWAVWVGGKKLFTEWTSSIWISLLTSYFLLSLPSLILILWANMHVLMNANEYSLYVQCTKQLTSPGLDPSSSGASSTQIYGQVQEKQGWTFMLVLPHWALDKTL